MPTSTFDATSHYNHLISTDSTLALPLAAIESLLILLQESPLTTVSETLSLISQASSHMLSSATNPIPISAGTDLFQRYLITSFNQTPLASQSGSDFTTLRKSLVSNGKVFISRAHGARKKIAENAVKIFGLGHAAGDHDEKSTVLTYGSSRVVDTVLKYAQDKGRWFNVIYVMPASLDTESGTATKTQITGLREAGVSVAVLPLAALSLAVQSLSQTAQTRDSKIFFLLGADAVLENGSIVSSLGTALVAETARTHQLPLYVATESYKFVRQYPLGYGTRDLEKLGTKQEVLHFAVRAETRQEEVVAVDGFDITPPDLITGLVTENGFITCSAVAEELIKLWF